MGVRKNARFLSPTEREDFVQACVKMKDAIINPAAPANQRYSEWDQHVAIHRMIQQAFAPGCWGCVNFGHGGGGAYSFLSWHRYFLYRFELRLQSYVPGVMLPYWDWTDPSSIMTDTFLGSDGDVAAGLLRVRQARAPASMPPPCRRGGRRLSPGGVCRACSAPRGRAACDATCPRPHRFRRWMTFARRSRCPPTPRSSTRSKPASA